MCRVRVLQGIRRARSRIARLLPKARINPMASLRSIPERFTAGQPGLRDVSGLDLVAAVVQITLLHRRYHVALHVIVLIPVAKIGDTILALVRAVMCTI